MGNKRVAEMRSTFTLQEPPAEDIVCRIQHMFHQITFHISIVYYDFIFWYPVGIRFNLG